jgi:hypothetical protein
MNHAGYWSAVRYLVVASAEKPREALDPAPLVWQRSGEHAPLLEVARAPTTAAAVEARREKAVLKAEQDDKAEPRPKEIDVWPLVVKHGIRNTHDNQDGHLRLFQIARQECSPAMVNYLFKIRGQLNRLIDDVWTWECIDDRVRLSNQTRAEDDRTTRQDRRRSNAGT